MRSRYDLADDSDTRSSNGSFYKDILTIPLDKFKYNSAPYEHQLTMIDIKRLDIMISNLYGVTEFDDLLLWINGIADPTTLSIGDTLSVPTKSDMEIFYYNSRE